MYFTWLQIFALFFVGFLAGAGVVFLRTRAPERAPEREKEETVPIGEVAELRQLYDDLKRAQSNLTVSLGLSEKRTTLAEAKVAVLEKKFSAASGAAERFRRKSL